MDKILFSFMFHLCYGSFFCFCDKVLIEFEKNVVIFFKEICLLDNFALKVDKLRNTFAIEFFEVVILCKSLKMSPYPFAIINGENSIKLGINLINLIAILPKLAIKLILLISENVNTTAKL